MSVTTMIEHMSRPVPIELQLLDRRDSAQAVLYRVGEPLDLLDTLHPLDGASLEAITDRLLPRLRHRRRRWIFAVHLDGPADLARPPHERPGLVAAAFFGRVLAGGLLAEQLDDFGADPVHRAVVIDWLTTWAGSLAIPTADTLPPDIAREPAATFTIGDLGQRSGRRSSATARSERDVQVHVQQLSLHGRRALITAEQRAAYDEQYRLFDEATDSVLRTFTPNFLVRELAMSSPLVDDLGTVAARILARDLLTRSTRPERVSQTLQLAGYINPSGHRRWRRELVQEVGA
jgi:hypothetical protein